MLAAFCMIPLMFLGEVELRGEILHLGDVADLSSLPSILAGRAGGTALLRVDRNVPQATVPRHELVMQVRARLPLLGNCFSPTGDPVLIRRPVAEAAPRVTAADAAGIGKGEEVGVRITAGPFAIERDGIAASDAKPGGRLFVRTSNGQVVRAVVEGAMP